MSRRKVVTEITIETSQILVINRRQVTRSRCSECSCEAEFAGSDFVRRDTGNVLVDQAGNQRSAGALSGTPHFGDAADGSDTVHPRSLRGATTLARRFLDCFRRGRKREDGPQE